MCGRQREREGVRKKEDREKQGAKPPGESEMGLCGVLCVGMEWGAVKQDGETVRGGGRGPGRSVGLLWGAG